MFIMIYYSQIGELAISFFHIPKVTFEVKIVAGFLVTFLLGMIVGFPSQLFSISYTAYWTIFFIVFFGILLFTLFNKREQLNIRFKTNRKNIFKKVLHHFSLHWFVYALVFVFSLLSMTNTQPYLWNNYHDDYYIGKMVNLVQTPHLLNENYILCYVLKRTSIFSYALQQGYRMFNTYELTYSFLGTLFHIDLAFFARCAMVIHNYLICFFIYKLFAELFVDRKYSQYTLIFFILLAIPAGYASRGMKIIFIRMFENWRFQTGIYFGGSVTRVFTLPLMILGAVMLLEKFEWRKLLLLILINVTLVSFQTNALCYTFFILPIVLLAFLIVKIFKLDNIKERIMWTIIVLSLFCILMMASDKILNSIGINVSKYQAIFASYQPYYNNVFVFDFFALVSLIPILLIFYMKHNDQKILFINIIVFVAFMIFRINKTNIYIAMISSNFYGIARILTSVLLLCVSYFGIVLVVLLERMSKKTLVLNVICFSLLLSLTVGIKVGNKTFKKYTLEEDNMTPLGYSFTPLTANDKMLPELVVKVGDYFNKLPYGNYRLLSEGHIPYKGTYIDNQSFLLSSNRIELWFDSRDEKVNIDYQKILLYLRGQLHYKDVEGIFAYTKFQYIYTTREPIMKDLLMHNCKVVMKDQVNHGWLLKVLKN